ncbi:hypothetical protein DAPK24_054470 [Pichia kluyveri]|uniref:Uncharacterized protein n=1 Tax=Pichia kluyveri TaxID=36015 RepID=A0AAV5RBB2_PICKL|nr:hypothetical protein DAPK24_054470 [Pichia kluyveri]
MPQDPVEFLKSQSKGTLSNTPSLSSDTTLSLSNSAVFTNGVGLVQKGTIAHGNKHHLTHSKHPDNNNNNNGDSKHDTNNYEEDEDEDVFELNWTPQVSSDNYTSGYINKI